MIEEEKKTEKENIKNRKEKLNILDVLEIAKKYWKEFQKKPRIFKNRAYVIGAAVVVLVLVWFRSPDYEERPEEKTTGTKIEEKTEKSGVFFDKEIDKKAYVKRLDGMYGEVAARVEEQERQTQGFENSLEDINKSVEELKEEGRSTSKDMATIKRVVSDLNEAIQKLTGRPISGLKADGKRYLGEERPVFEGEAKTGEYKVPRGSMATKITVFQVKKEEEKKEVVPEEEEFLMLPAGSFVDCTLLSGVYAPADSSRPLPVLIRMDDAFIGPNKSKVPLEGIFGLCKATGELVSERAILQLQQISVVMKDGKTFNEEGNLGYLAGEDAALGLKGKVIKNTGRLIWNALFSGYLGGAAEALAMGKTQTTIGGQGQIVQDINKKATGDYAAYSGLSAAAQRMSDYYMGQLEQLIPVVYVAAGRKITVVMTKSIKIKGYKLEKYDRYMEEEY
ncbi:hypothetical protein KKC91_06935 [bacterium]|nr:hypothetical protein [bacterium]